jgi:hypothetical protein
LYWAANSSTDAGEPLNQVDECAVSAEGGSVDDVSQVEELGDITGRGSVATVDSMRLKRWWCVGLSIGANYVTIKR